MTGDKMKIEYVALAEIRRWPKNPKAHDDQGIGDAIDRWGFNDPMVRDANTGQLVEGHGRLKQLESKRDAGEDPPPRIMWNGGDWKAPVITIPFKNEAEAEAYLLAHNKLTEVGGWHESELLDMLENHQALGEDALRGTGFNPDELVHLIQVREHKRRIGDPDLSGDGDSDEGGDGDESGVGNVETKKCPHCGGDVPI